LIALVDINYKFIKGKKEEEIKRIMGKNNNSRVFRETDEAINAILGTL
jgi:hypothetical protein